MSKCPLGAADGDYYRCWAPHLIHAARHRSRSARLILSANGQLPTAKASEQYGRAIRWRWSSGATRETKPGHFNQRVTSMFFQPLHCFSAVRALVGQGYCSFQVLWGGKETWQWDQICELLSAGVNDLTDALGESRSSNDETDSLRCGRLVWAWWTRARVSNTVFAFLCLQNIGKSFEFWILQNKQKSSLFGIFSLCTLCVCMEVMESAQLLATFGVRFVMQSLDPIYLHMGPLTYEKKRRGSEFGLSWGRLMRNQ